MKTREKIRAVLWNMDGVLVREELPIHAAQQMSSAEPAGAAATGQPQLDPDLVDFISAMRSEVQTALLVRSWSEVWQTVSHLVEIQRAFDRVILPAGQARRKPSRSLLVQAIRELGVRPSETIFVDDSPHQISAARSAGLHTVQFEDAAQAGSQIMQMLLEPIP